MALLGIFLISFSVSPEFSSRIFQVRARVSPGSSLALCFGVHSLRTRLGYKQLRRKPIGLLFVNFHSDQILLQLRRKPIYLLLVSFHSDQILLQIPKFFAEAPSRVNIAQHTEISHNSNVE